MPKIDLDINKLDWLALARIAAPILAPIVLAGAWVIFTKFDNKAKWLSSLFSVSELIPTVNLNLPSGIVLGSFYVTGKEILESGLVEDIKDTWDATSSLVEDFIKKEGIYKKEPDLVEDIVTRGWKWLTGLELQKDSKFGPGKGLA